jgi:hypothetical protein
MQQRIYTYKITFEEVPYYYYGSKKERVFDEEYWGSPVTNKWCWELYTPKKQILEVFDYTDEGYSECISVENRLIKPVLNDLWCLNESFSNFYSLKVLSDAGKKGGNSNKENKTGFCGRTKEKMKEDGRLNGKIGGNRTKELNKGYCGLIKEQRSEYGKIGGNISKDLCLGICGLSKEQRVKNAKKQHSQLTDKEKHSLYEKGLGKLTKEQRVEIYEKGLGKLSKEELQENYKRGIGKLTKEQRIENSKKGAYQKWQCLETGFITNAGNLTQYQKSRGIDTSKRIRIL